MHRRTSTRRYGLVFSAIVVAVLLLATLLLAGSAQSAGARPGTTGQRGALSFAPRSGPAQDLSRGLPTGRTPHVAGASTYPFRWQSGITEARGGTDSTEHPFSVNLLRRSQSADHPSANPFRRRQSADHPSVDSAPAGWPQAQVEAALRSSPIMFIENVGQFDDRARFQVRDGPGIMWLADDAIWITLVERWRVERSPLHRPDMERTNVQPANVKRVNVKLTFPGANPYPRLEPFDRLDTAVSYFIGNDPDEWHPDVPVWAGVRYVDLYPGVDLELTSDSGRWTWRLVCRANCQFAPQDVRLRVEGADALAPDRDRVSLTTAVGDFTLPLPTTDLVLDVEGITSDSQLITFRLASVPSPGARNGGKQTADEPAGGRQQSAVTQDNPDNLLYSTFLGGNSSDEGRAIAVDKGGDVYVTGTTLSSDFPTTPGAFDTSYNGNEDVFVAKLNANGSDLIYATVLGGSGQDNARSITVDGAGSAYVAGGTSSLNFPTTPTAVDTSYDGNFDIFVVRLNAEGTGLFYSTFLGGSDWEYNPAIAVDGSGNAYITGGTSSVDFPTTPNAFDRTCGTDGNCNQNDPAGPVIGDAFGVKLNANGTDLVYSTLLGGSGGDYGHAIAVDGAGSAYVTGTTESSDFPTTPGAFDTSYNGGDDAFVIKLNATGSALVFATFLGGGSEECLRGCNIAVDGSGAAYVTGETDSSDFPTTPGAFDTTYGGGICYPSVLCPDAFVVKLNATGSNLAYANFLGGSHHDWGNAIAVDGSGAAYVTGLTSSSDFPTTPGAFDTTYGGGICGIGVLCPDAFVVKVNATGSALTYATFLGGSDGEAGNGIAVDGSGAAYVTGETGSSDFPTTAEAFDTSYNGGGDAFVAKLVVGGGPGPVSPTLAAVPASVPADGTSTSTVTLSGAPANHRVRLISSRGSVDTFSPATGTTDANGRFVATVRSSTPGTAVITVQDLSTGQTFAASVGVTFTPVGGEPPPPPPNEGAIAITDIRSDLPLDGRYLEGVSAPNRIEVSVDWKGTAPGSVDFILNNQTHSVSASSWGAGYMLNMGQELQGGTNRLQIVARNAVGATSTSVDTAPYLLSKPVWLSGLQSLGAMANFALAGPVTVGREYVSTVRIPPQPIRFGAPGFGPPGSKTELQFYVGGGTKLQLRCGAPLVIEALGGAEANLDLMGVELGGELKGSGNITAGAIQCEIPTARGTIRLDVKAYGQKDWPVLTFVVDFISPGAGTALEQTLRSVGLYGLMRMLGEIYLQANLNGFFESGAHTVLESPYLEWEGARLGGGPGLEAGYRYKQAILEFKVFLGGKGTAEFVNPNPLRDLTNLHFDRVVVRGEAGYEVRAGWFGDEKRYFVEWAFPSQGQTFVTQARPLQVEPSQWRLLGHGYRNKPYAAFHKPPPGKLTPFSPQALGYPPNPPIGGQGVAATTAGEVLVSNVYTYTEPSLALNPANDNALLLWVHDDVSKPVGQNFDLAYSHWDGSTWSTPGRVTDDTYLDGAPQAAWDGSDKGLAVWERLNDPALAITATLDTTTTQKIEIAWAQYDPGADTWGDPAWLTTNSALDHKPILARNAAGAVMAAWRQNAAGLLSGDAANPDRVMFATWDGSTWSTPAVAVDDVPGLVDLAAGYGTGAATIAYTRFLTPTGSITPTLQLFTSTWDGGAWSPPQQLTDDDLGHTNPQVVYNTLNQPLLVWQAGDTLRLRDLTTDAEVDLALDPDLVVDEFRLLHDAAGNLAAVFTGQQAGQRDLFVAFFDAGHNAWGRPYRLTNDRHSEGYPAPTLDSTGRLLIAYALTQITSEERTTTDPQTGETITYTLPVEGQTDLYTLSHQFVQDLAMGALAVSDTHPPVGASVTVSATVTNTGALALDGVQVGFYEGDPGAGGTLIDTVTLPGTLAAGYTATLTTTYTISATAGQQQLVAVVDPQNDIAEADETNNRGSIFAFGPDLELAGAGVDYWSGSSVGLTAVIRNIGTMTSPTTTIAYRWDAITGTLAVTDIVPTLEAGQAITLTTSWDYGALASASYPLAAIVNENQADFSEIFIANNSLSLSLSALPDLVVSPLYLWTDALPDAQVVVTATVYNFGSVPAPPADVAIYVDEPLTDTTRIGTVSLPALDPGGNTYITTTWGTPAYGEHTFYVAVDPQRTVTETTWTNNLASVSGASACTLLEGDVNCSCSVNVADLQIVAGRWHETAGLPYDLDGDDWVTVADIMRVAAVWGRTCPGE